MVMLTKVKTYPSNLIRELVPSVQLLLLNTFGKFMLPFLTLGKLMLENDLKEMNHQPLVSVIMIFFNEEKFIEEAIASIIAQIYKHWELLLVDDGSTDRSTEIAKSYAEKYPEKVRYLEHENHENRGMSATRNLGISNNK
jgi:cellulose synthase/poly-beta-1,6-N-acetylglucosamine synthase-like glycosyltransferase